jgi:hypothetical protein
MAENVKRAREPGEGAFGLGGILGNLSVGLERGFRGGGPPEMTAGKQPTRSPTSPQFAAIPNAGRASPFSWRATLPSEATRRAEQPVIPAAIQEFLDMAPKQARKAEQPVIPHQRSEQTRGLIEALMIPRAVTPTADVKVPATGTTGVPGVTPAAITRGAGGEYNINVKISGDVGMEKLIEKLADTISDNIEEFGLASILGQND